MMRRLAKCGRQKSANGESLQFSTEFGGLVATKMSSRLLESPLEFNVLALGREESSRYI